MSVQYDVVRDLVGFEHMIVGRIGVVQRLHFGQDAFGVGRPVFPIRALGPGSECRAEGVLIGFQAGIVDS